MEAVLARIESREFRLCKEFVAIMEKVRNKQLEVFAERKEIMMTVFNTDIDKLYKMFEMRHSPAGACNPRQRTAMHAYNVGSRGKV